MKSLGVDAYDGMSFFGGLVFFAPVALLARTRAGISEGQFFLLQVLLSAVIALGELPTGHLTDRVGYRSSLILSRLLLLTARGALLAAYLLRSLPLFALEAVIEGVAACLASGTDSAYLYALWGEDEYLPKTARAANFGAAGFLLSTVSYAAIYHRFDLKGLLIATVISGAAGFVCALFLRGDVHGSAAGIRGEKANLSQLLRLLRDRRARQFTALLSLFSVAWLLVNFFYAEILARRGVPLVWLSAIIVGYSLAQMLAEPLIHLRGRFAKREPAAFFCLLGGAVLLGLGCLRRPWVLLLMMVFLPLFLDLAAFCVEEQQNRLIDTLALGNDRAAALSLMNMGVNLVEILSLFASSFLVAAGIGWCFCLCGAFLMLGAWRLYGGKSEAYGTGRMPPEPGDPGKIGKSVCRTPGCGEAGEGRDTPCAFPSVQAVEKREIEREE